MIIVPLPLLYAKKSTAITITVRNTAPAKPALFIRWLAASPTTPPNTLESLILC